MRGQIEINLKNLIQNYKILSSKLPKEVDRICVVKADGYGHGAVEVAKEIINFEEEQEKLYGTPKVDSREICFAVATADEALQLCENQIKDVLVLGVTDSAEKVKLIKNGVILSCHNCDDFVIIENLAKKIGRVAKVAIKLDTGMNRFGLKGQKPLYKSINSIKSSENLNVKYIFSHLSDCENGNFSLRQIDCFENLSNKFYSSSILAKRNLLATEGLNAVLSKPWADDSLFYDGVRLGIGLYGYRADGVKPVMEVKGKVLRVQKVFAGERVGYGDKFIPQKDCYIATVPLGYADGIRRDFSGGSALIGRKTRKIVGNICMDCCFCIVDEKVKIFDEVVFIGSQGNLTLTAEDMAKKCDTIEYEILTGFKRIPRIYL